METNHEHENAVAMQNDLYQAYRSLDGAEALAVAEEIMWEQDEHVSDDILEIHAIRLSALACVTDYMIEEYSSVVVRGEEQDTFDVFLIDEDRLFVDIRKNVSEDDLEKSYLHMGQEWRARITQAQ